MLYCAVVICSCSNAQKDNSLQDDSLVYNEATINDTVKQQTEFAINETQVDTFTKIQFEELLLTINRLIILDEQKKLNQIQKDTVEVNIELGETIEGQQINIVSEQLTNIKVAQRYENSVTIMNEEPHCDLPDWTHYYSDWKQLAISGTNQFICDVYNEKDYEKFPDVLMNDLKQEVKRVCGKEWYKLVENTKSVREYPYGVGLSRYYLKITAQRKDNNQTVTKLIILNAPMGC